MTAIAPAIGIAAGIETGAGTARRGGTAAVIEMHAVTAALAPKATGLAARPTVLAAMARDAATALAPNRRLATTPPATTPPATRLPAAMPPATTPPGRKARAANHRAATDPGAIPERRAPSSLRGQIRRIATPTAAANGRSAPSAADGADGGGDVADGGKAAKEPSTDRAAPPPPASSVRATVHAATRRAALSPRPHRNRRRHCSQPRPRSCLRFCLRFCLRLRRRAARRLGRLLHPPRKNTWCGHPHRAMRHAPDRTIGKKPADSSPPVFRQAGGGAAAIADSRPR